ncbi:MAG TPA: DsrE family protein [Dissulfurispiraceae bacterium]|nr:DsrE family protein [Dissulfurispiraceae bacterium]
MAKFLFVLNRGMDDPVRATRCIHLSKVAKESGHDVNVFLVDDGVNIARIGMADNMKSPTGDELKPLLDAITKAGVPILVCTPCANARHMGEEDLIAGARFEKATLLISLAAESKVLTF